MPSYLTFPSDINWQTQHSEHFQIIFRKGEDRFAERALLAAEKAYRILTPIFPDVPSKTYIVLADFQDSTNGYALTFPYPHIVLFAAPPDSPGQLAALDDWLPSVVLHEFVHILHVYPANGAWKILRTLFGSIISPNGLMPSHFHEGLAVLMETEKTQGGRGRSATFNAYRRMAVEEGVWGTTQFFSIDQMDGAPHRWPQGTTPYFFGYHLYEDLWRRKGPKGIYSLVEDYSRNWPIFFLNGPLKNVYGLNYPQLWSEIYARTTEETKKENAQIKAEGLNELGYLTDTRQGKWDLTVSPEKNRIAFRRYNPDEGGAIDIVDNEMHRLDKISTNGSGNGMCWIKQKNGEEILYFLDGETINQYQLNVLRAYHPESKNVEKIEAEGVRLAHLHEIGCSSDGQTLLLYQEKGGKGAVREIVLGEDGKWKSSRDWVIPEGSWVTSIHFAKSGERFFLRRGIITEVYLWTKGEKPHLTNAFRGHLFDAHPGTHDDETLAIAELDGRNEIWSFDWSKNTATKVVSLLGGAGSFDFGKDTLYLTSYHHGGFDIATVAKRERKKTIKLSKVSAKKRDPAEASDKEHLSSVESYSPLETLVPRTWVPSFLIVPDGAQFGFFVPSFDLSQKHFFQMFGGYDTRGLPFGDISHTYRFGTTYSVNGDVYYLPSYLIASKQFFKRWGATVTVGGSINSNFPTLNIGPVFKRTEPLGVLPANQSVGVQIGLSYKTGFRKNPMSISPLRGTGLSLVWNQYFKKMGSTHNYYSAVGSVEQYLENPIWKEHVFFANAKVGWTEGTDFYVNYFDSGGEVLFSQGRGLFLNRGYLPGTFYGRRMFNLNLEYRFPIANIYRGFELLPFYIKEVYGSFVADTTSLDRDPQNFSKLAPFKVFYNSVGFELRSDWQLGFYLPAHMRLGGYHGFDSVFGQTLYFVLGMEASI